jgi:very-short-patch-repair endonuclease
MKGVSVEYPMYFGATPNIFKKAKELRKTQTEAERVVWSRLNKNQIHGLQFRRQHPINIFVADFYCPKVKLVIEIDGSIHNISEYHDHDIARSEILNDFGITIIRFSNEQILNNIDITIMEIEGEVKKLLDLVPKPPI